MSYISLYRKWRSQDFEDIVGQQHIIKTLKNAIAQNRISHAYLFCGPRGTGKTSIARILAKALNCKDGPTGNPCGKCDNCIKIRDGHAVDVIEIDAASNRGIDEIRDLREKVRYAPIEGRYKIYIIDEVHMLTTEAFNALLKTLEEPPAHVIFILATTEPGKVPITIASRCQRLDFERIPLKQVKEHLEKIAKSEGIKIEERALDTVARTGEGSMRDSISLLDQLISFAGKSVTFDDVAALIGCADEELLFGMTDAISGGNDAKLLDLLRSAIDQGRSSSQVVRDLLNHFRNLLFAKVQAADLLELIKEYQDRIVEQAKKFDLNTIKTIMRALSRAELDMKWHPHARIVLEVALLELVDNLKGSPAQPEVPQSKKDLAPVRSFRETLSVLKSEKPAPPAPVKEMAAPVSGDGKFGMIRSKWPDILEEAKKRSLFGYISLHEGDPVGINEKGKLVIGFRKGYSFHREQLEQQKNKEVIEKVIEDIIGENIKIESIVGDLKGESRPTVSVETVKDIFEGEVL